ncbi:MmgE/PrpD family protein [Glutamicibacter arilaitensis]|uniref:MmgE/PrpD family protein n=1 Tax=Glutamicibacter arilaitensis TaxID=256701 RepID=UPI00384C0E33
MEQHTGLAPGSITSQLANHIVNISWDNIPAEVRQRAVELIADTLGSVVAGQELDSTQALMRGLDAAGTLDGEFRIPGWQEKLSPTAVAMLSGASAHGFDFDDTHAPAQIHPGAPVVSAALAAAQTPRNDGTLPTAQDFITGVIAGYEAMTRVSYGLNADSHARRGFHLSSTTGVFGAAAAVNVVLGYDQDTLEHAWGTALSMTGGSGQFMLNGAWTKRVHVGNAAANGYLTVRLANAGVTGAADALTGRDGFFNLYCNEPTPDLAVKDLAKWEIMGTGVKPYACCRAIHASLEAVLNLQQEHGFEIDDVHDLVVGVPERCYQVTCDPQEMKRNPHNIVDCQFSMHLCLAQAISTKRFELADYESSLQEPKIKNLMQRIKAYVDEEADALYPQSFPSRVKITLNDGTALQSWIEVPLGEPSRMPSQQQVRDKFVGLAASPVGEDLAHELFDNILAMLDDAGQERLASLFKVSEEQSVVQS